MNTIQGKLGVQENQKVVIIASRFNSLITDKLIEGAKDIFIRSGGSKSNIDLILVPGAFEIPFALEKVASGKKYNGACCLGAVIRGSTPHFDYVSAEATKGIASVGLKYAYPVSFGVLTTQTLEQALERAGSKAGNKGAYAMQSLIEMINLYETLN